MEEIYLYSAATAVLDMSETGVVLDATPVANIYYANTDFTTTPPPTPLATPTVSNDFPEEYNFAFPINLTAAENEYLVRWTYSVSGNQVTRDNYYAVVTPYVSLAELRAVHENLSTLEDDQLILIEQSIRHLFDSITNQHFGNHTATVAVMGDGSNSLKMPERLYQLQTIQGGRFVNDPSYNLSVMGLYIGPDFMTIEYPGFTYYDIKSDTPPVEYSYNSYYGPNGPIAAPRLDRNGFFQRGYLYYVTGTFGWPYVPADIKLAAKLWAKDLIQNEDIYRQRGLLSVTSGQWTFEFEPGTTYKTGNRDVDKILDRYTWPQMLVV